MITSSVSKNQREVTITNGWLLFVAWASSNGYSTQDLKRFHDRHGDFFIEYLELITSVWSILFEEYAQENYTTTDELSMSLFSSIRNVQN